MRSKKSIYFTVFRYLIALIILSTIVGGSLFLYYLRGMPSIDDLTKNPLTESTVIYDKDGNELYKLFRDGKRTYISYNNISPSIRDAIVSIEDKTFFTNPGIDIRGLLGAGIDYITGKSAKLRGASTISQQLIKNTLLTNEQSIKRKIQEAVLSYELNHEHSKEKILELYLNVISFGNNAFWVEEASKIYFGKSAREVWPLGASILASLPKWPTQYSPYLHRDRLMGYTYVYSPDTPESTVKLETQDNKASYRTLYDSFHTYIQSLEITRGATTAKICHVLKENQKSNEYFPDSVGCIEVDYDRVLDFVGNIKLQGAVSSGSGTTQTMNIEYTFGRKDQVATRMLEDGKITGAEFRDILYNGLDFTFQKYAENIRYPYFVFYIKEYLEETYGKDIDITNGLRVYTSIDPKLQDKAEEILRAQVEINKTRFGASSAALVSMDNKTGHILAMVGGPDYFDEDHGGNNNMVLAKRQPGSSFKPFIYSLAISKWPIGPESPIADVRTTFAKWIPDNYDQKFEGVMALKNALDYSRNIPAVKMFYLAGGEDAVVGFGHQVGLASLQDNAGYGAPLAIGSAEVKPIEMLAGYSVFANGGISRKITGILKIEDSDRNILEEWKPKDDPVIFSPAASYIISRILSDNSARPASDFWRNALTLKGWRVAAAKTGTSNKDVSNGGRKSILPRDLWTIGYTPQITTVVWAGNVDGKETKGTCDGLNCAAPIWRQFMDFAHEWLPKEDFIKPTEWLYTATISKYTGKLASDSTPEGQSVSTIMAVKPTEYDAWVKTMQIDTLCNGPLSENTPEEAIKSIYLPADKPIIDGYDPKWTEGFFEASKMGLGSGTGAIVLSDAPCDRPGGPGNISLSLRVVTWESGATVDVGRKLVEAGWIGDRKIQTLRILQNNELKYDTTFDTGSARSSGTQRAVINISGANETTLKIEVVDMFGYRYKESKTLNVKISGTAPKILMKNPVEGDTSTNLYKGDPINLRFSLSLSTEERELVVLLDGKNIYTATSGDIFVIPIISSDLTPWDHTLKIRVTDGNFKQVEKNITLTILPR